MKARYELWLTVYQGGTTDCYRVFASDDREALEAQQRIIDAANPTLNRKNSTYEIFDASKPQCIPNSYAGIAAKATNGSEEQK